MRFSQASSLITLSVLQLVAYQVLAFVQVPSIHTSVSTNPQISSVSIREESIFRARSSKPSVSTSTRSGRSLQPRHSLKEAVEICPFSLGGEWAGWECRFSQTDGGRINIGEEFTPSSLQEWDIDVWGFEVLTSEEQKSGNLYRKSGQVYPETGCALDDLALKVEKSSINVDTIVHAKGGHGYAYISGTDRENMYALEACMYARVPTQENGAGEHMRTRFTVHFDKSKKIVRPVTVCRERRYSEKFDDGHLYIDGLDIRTLTATIGGRCFSEYESAPESEPEVNGGENSQKVLAFRGGYILRSSPLGFEFEWRVTDNGPKLKLVCAIEGSKLGEVRMEG